MNRSFPSKVSAYINIHLSSLQFSLRTDIINYSDILLIYLKDTEVNIDNVLVMTGDFNIRDSLWDTLFPHYSSISNDLLIIADSFNLTLSSSTNPCPTRYSDTKGVSNSVIDLMFFQYGSDKTDYHSIHSEWCLILDHAPLTISIPIMDEVINTSRLSIQQNSEQEVAFVEEVTSIFKNLDTSSISNKSHLENMVNHLNMLINQAWDRHAKQSRTTKDSRKS